MLQCNVGVSYVSFVYSVIVTRKRLMVVLLNKRTLELLREVQSLGGS